MVIRLGTQGVGDIGEQGREIDYLGLNSNTQHGLDLLADLSDLVLQGGSVALEGDLDRWDLRDASPALLLHALLEQLLGQGGITRGGCSLRTLEIGVVAGHALRYDMTGGRACAMVKGLHDHIFVNRQLECLADIDVIKRLVQVVHGKVVNRQLRLLAIFLGLGLGYFNILGWDGSDIDLVGLVGGISALNGLVEVEIDLLQLRLGIIIVRIGNKDDASGVAVALHFEWAGTTLAAVITQMVGPLETPLIDDALFDHVGSRIRKRFQEVTRLLIHLDDDGTGIGSQQAIADQGRNLAVDALVRIFDQTEVGQRNAVERGNLGRQRAVNAIDHILRCER